MIYDNQGEYNRFMINEGEICFVPSGFIHQIENLSKTTSADFIMVFSHELPEDFNVSSAFSAITDAIRGNTVELRTSASEDVIKKRKAQLIGTMPKITNISNDNTCIYPNKYKFNLEKMAHSSIGPEGSVKIVSKKNWPVVENISMCFLVISTTDMSEPHWHPNTTEIVYVVEGSARLTIISCNDNHQLYTFQLKTDDVYFVLRAHLHHIQKTKNTDVKILMFFDRSTPMIIGYKGSISAFGKVLGAIVPFNG